MSWLLCCKSRYTYINRHICHDCCVAKVGTALLLTLNCLVTAVNSSTPRPAPLKKWRNSLFPTSLGHLLQRSRYKWESREQNQTSHRALWRSSHHCEETEMVWAQNKINRTCKDDPTGHCTRREKERQTEKEMGRQHNGVDRIKVGWSPLKGRKQRRMENSGCPIILGAPTVK